MEPSRPKMQGIFIRDDFNTSKNDWIIEDQQVGQNNGIQSSWTLVLHGVLQYKWL